MESDPEWGAWEADTTGQNHPDEADTTAAWAQDHPEVNFWGMVEERLGLNQAEEILLEAAAEGEPSTSKAMQAVMVEVHRAQQLRTNADLLLRNKRLQLETLESLNSEIDKHVVHLASERREERKVRRAEQRAARREAIERQRLERAVAELKRKKQLQAEKQQKEAAKRQSRQRFGRSGGVMVVSKANSQVSQGLVSQGLVSQGLANKSAELKPTVLPTCAPSSPSVLSGNLFASSPSGDVLMDALRSQAESRHSRIDDLIRSASPAAFSVRSRSQAGDEDSLSIASVTSPSHFRSLQLGNPEDPIYRAHKPPQLLNLRQVAMSRRRSLYIDSPSHLRGSHGDLNSPTSRHTPSEVHSNSSVSTERSNHQGQPPQPWQRTRSLSLSTDCAVGSQRSARQMFLDDDPVPESMQEISASVSRQGSPELEHCVKTTSDSSLKRVPQCEPDLVQTAPHGHRLNLALDDLPSARARNNVCHDDVDQQEVILKSPTGGLQRWDGSPKFSSSQALATPEDLRNSVGHDDVDQQEVVLKSPGGLERWDGSPTCSPSQALATPADLPSARPRNNVGHDGVGQEEIVLKSPPSGLERWEGSPKSSSSQTPAAQLRTNDKQEIASGPRWDGSPKCSSGHVATPDSVLDVLQPCERAPVNVADSELIQDDAVEIVQLSLHDNESQLQPESPEQHTDGIKSAQSSDTPLAEDCKQIISVLDTMLPTGDPLNGQSSEKTRDQGRGRILGQLNPPQRPTETRSEVRCRFKDHQDVPAVQHNTPSSTQTKPSSSTLQNVNQEVPNQVLSQPHQSDSKPEDPQAATARKKPDGDQTITSPDSGLLQTIQKQPDIGRVAVSIEGRDVAVPPTKNKNQNPQLLQAPPSVTPTRTLTGRTSFNHPEASKDVPTSVRKQEGKHSELRSRMLDSLEPASAPAPRSLFSRWQNSKQETTEEQKLHHSPMKTAIHQLTLDAVDNGGSDVVAKQAATTAVVSSKNSGVRGPQKPSQEEQDHDSIDEDIGSEELPTLALIPQHEQPAENLRNHDDLSESFWGTAKHHPIFQSLRQQLTVRATNRKADRVLSSVLAKSGPLYSEDLIASPPAGKRATKPPASARQVKSPLAKTSLGKSSGVPLRNSGTLRPTTLEILDSLDAFAEFRQSAPVAPNRSHREHITTSPSKGPSRGRFANAHDISKSSSGKSLPLSSRIGLSRSPQQIKAQILLADKKEAAHRRVQEARKLRAFRPHDLMQIVADQAGGERKTLDVNRILVEYASLDFEETF